MNKKELDNQFQELLKNNEAYKLKSKQEREESLIKRIQLIDELLKPEIETMIEWFNEKHTSYKLKCEIHQSSSITTFQLVDENVSKKWFALESPKIIQLFVFLAGNELGAKIWHNFSKRGQISVSSNEHDISQAEILETLRNILFEILEKGITYYPKIKY